MLKSQTDTVNSEETNTEQSPAKPVLVSELKQQLEVAGIDTLPLSNKEAEQFNQAVEKHADFFDKVCQQKNDRDPILLLLGLLTKTQVEATHKLQAQIDTIVAMGDVFTNTVGDEQSNKFHAEAVIELSLMTKLWLMVQGYLNMDFSLANDHAQQSSILLSKALRTEVDEIRTDFLSCYYHGKNKHKEEAPKSGWSGKLKRWFLLD